MWHELLGFVLNALDEHERSLVVDFLRSNPQACEAVDRLRTRCQWLEAARDEHAPPAELAVRTCQRVRFEERRRAEAFLRR
jgi:hypothetical protein